MTSTTTSGNGSPYQEDEEGSYTNIKEKFFEDEELGGKIKIENASASEEEYSEYGYTDVKDFYCNNAGDKSEDATTVNYMVANMKTEKIDSVENLNDASNNMAEVEDDRTEDQRGREIGSTEDEEIPDEPDGPKVVPGVPVDATHKLSGLKVVPGGQVDATHEHSGPKGDPGGPTDAKNGAIGATGGAKDATGESIDAKLEPVQPIETTKLKDAHDSEVQDISGIEILMETGILEGPPLKKRRRIVETDFICDVCNKSFSKPYNLRRHMETHKKEKIVEFACTKCDKTYAKKCGLASHCRTYHPDFRECERCKQIFLTKKELLEHQKIHKDEEIHKCSICEKILTSSGMLTLHMKRKHSIGSENKCELCGKIFEKKCKLNLHMLRHTNIKAFKCETCGKAFATKYQVSKHVRQRHNEFDVVNDGEFVCKYCSEVLTSLLDLKGHLEQHFSEEKPYACNLCNRTFARSNNLTSHKKRDHSEGMVIDGGKLLPVVGADGEEYTIEMKEERPFQCEICSKSYKTKNDLRRHSEIHTEERPFQCHLCGVKFKRQTHLSSHIACRHTDDKPFECHVCGKRFKLDRYRTIHVKEMHGNLRKFFCGGCGEGFTKHVDLKHHITKKHSNDPDLHVCTKCGEKFDSEEKLLHHGSSICKFCGQVFCIRLDMIKHERKHDMSGDTSHSLFLKKANTCLR